MITFVETTPVQPPVREMRTTIGNHKVALRLFEQRWQACAWVGIKAGHEIPLYGYGDTPEAAVADMANYFVGAAETIAQFAEAHAAALGKAA